MQYKSSIYRWAICLSAILLQQQSMAQKTGMNEMWKGDARLQSTDSARGKIFRNGRYAMFIHFGYFSHLANKWNGKTYYGIGEWLMNENMAKISVKDYMANVGDFNPANFNADSIVAVAKDAGMKYIIITSKHHDGFAMFHSKATKFNIVDATPFRRDPMKELALACQKAGLGFGFYYSQYQDWTTPGGGGGPATDENGKAVSFDEYFYKRCLPEVEQITTEYGPLALVWFDTPGGIGKKYVEKLVEVVHKNQPAAFVSGRVGHGLGDYSTLGDMEVPRKNVPGLWESVDVTNDSWGYAWYDNNWKSPKTILTNTLSTIARGGNYMLNIGPKDDGTVAKQAAAALRSAGSWIKRYPEIVYKSSASPWKHALPWGDAVVNGNKISLLVYDWPSTGKLYVPGLQTGIKTIQLVNNGRKEPLKYHKDNNCVVIDLPYKAPEKLVSVIELVANDTPRADETQSIDPQHPTLLDALFAKADNVAKNGEHWMEKFGEWKHVDRFINWKPNATANWTVDVLKPGYYQSSLFYTGKSRLVWRIAMNGDQFIQNQQSASAVYNWYPMGWLYFDKPGRYTLSVSLMEGEGNTTSLAALKLEPLIF
ncbi:alpha-L-fucosidase [Chitinophagaceae bacterium LB-8]|uniref:alpha-L-fucosidase n=1 Tax=Paraflavisolibacter caeni TaxID=2982496 RepID=A0A9X2Y0R5_9BACT|nr:alpha-L-fucosidase [Paraflavisolibacter caeni]MCU7552541.1 alpha-L-fucosidase [Paraflavisolibacter caeni]